jgi:hypothetical protein
MTPARQGRKSQWLLGFWVSATLAASVLALQAGALGASVTVVNPHTGLAISGFDPLAYFLDGRPAIGRPDYELNLDGMVWRFRNEGNRYEFAAHPEIYTPRFGGYDPVAIARNRLIEGHPLIWAITEQQLYFFYDEAARKAFMGDPGRVLEMALQNWPKLAHTIAR